MQYNVQISFIFCKTATVGTDVNEHLQNLNYAACVEPQDNYCGIRWSPTSEFSFVTDGDAVGNSVLIGQDGGIADPFDAFTLGNPCVDYITLVGGVSDTDVSRDRYCGFTFPTTVTSKSLYSFPK